MDFRLTEDQEALRDGVRAFCEGRFGVERLDETARAGGFDRDLWGELASMGVFALRRPESEGGVGLGMADAALVFVELGRRLVPGPAIWSHLAATLDQPEVGDPARAVSSAKVAAFDAAMKNARACIQIHGGMGYTWEMPPHWYLKRAWVLGASFGTSELHEERLAAQLDA